MDDLWKQLPTYFNVDGDHVDVYNQPHEFYQQLMNGIQMSKNRIVLSSLYIGSGELEQKLLSCVETSMASVHDLKFHILLDYTRGMRGSRNSRSMLLPLKKQFSNRVKLSFFHTPNLKGSLKKWMPAKFNELLGLQHMKAYIFDDTLVLSGANLSTDYFTNRQDRCIVIQKEPKLCDYFMELVSTVSKFSYDIDEQSSISFLKEGIGSLTKDFNVDTFCTYAKDTMENFIHSHHKKQFQEKYTDTRLYPTLQMASFGINLDNQVVKMLLQLAPCNSTIYFSTAYFNPTEEFIELIKSSLANVNILTASPQANGFFAASGLTSYVPMAYSFFEKDFYCKVVARKLHVSLSEFKKANWTFHVKGLWYTAPQELEPSMTIVGSSNFGYRSVYRDLEAQAVIVTNNSNLKKKLFKEQRSIYKYAFPVSSSTFSSQGHFIPFWAPYLARLTKRFF